jgi:hypothetical protein
MHLLGWERELTRPLTRSPAAGTQGLAEEKRLLYVGCSRAVSRLFVSYFLPAPTDTPKGYGQTGPPAHAFAGYQNQQPSRFLTHLNHVLEPITELEGQVRECIHSPDGPLLGLSLWPPLNTRFAMSCYGLLSSVRSAAADGGDEAHAPSRLVAHAHVGIAAIKDSSDLLPLAVHHAVFNPVSRPDAAE